MKLHEIIEQNNANETNSILVETLVPYKKQLLTWFTNEFIGEPMLMVVSVFNACQYAKIVDEFEFSEAINKYLGVDYIETDSNDPNFNSDLFCDYETICSNSMVLSKL